MIFPKPPIPPPMKKLREGIDKIRIPDVPVPAGPIHYDKENKSIFSKITHILDKFNKKDTLKDIINKDKTNNKYLIVLHNYWMRSNKGFEKFIIEADSELLAEKEAALMAYKRTKMFNNCNYTVIKL